MHFYPRYGLADLIASPTGPSLGELGENGSSKPLEALQADQITGAATDLAEHYVKKKLRVYGPPSQDEPGTEGVLSEVESEVGQTSGDGYYTRPHALVEAGGSLNSVIRSPEPGARLLKGHCPFAAKMSIGYSSAKNTKTGELFNALSSVTTYTPNKIAMRWPGTDDRLGLIPDLPLRDMVTFIRFYRTYVQPHVDLVGATVTQSGNWRLRCNDGTYPDPAPPWAFGALGLTAGLMRWAERLGYAQRAQAILSAIDRVYVIGTKTKYQEVEPLRNHVLRLAEKGTLWRLLRDANDQVDASGSDDEMTEFRLFLRRWLTTFEPYEFQRFLSVRTRYPSSFHPALKQYFLMSHDKALIESAKAAGHHISDKAYSAADGNTEEANKILDGIESRLVEATGREEMIASLTTRVGRLTGSMFTPEATPFFDAVLAGDVGLDDAKNLLMAYMRVFPEKHAGESDGGSDQGRAKQDDRSGETSPTDDVPHASSDEPDSGDALKV